MSCFDIPAVIAEILSNKLGNFDEIKGLLTGMIKTGISYT